MVYELSDNDKHALVGAVEYYMKSIIRDIRQNDLIIHNPALSLQYKEDYINLLKETNSQDWQVVRNLKVLINRIMRTIVYGEDETGKKDEFYEFSQWRGLQEK